MHFSCMPVPADKTPIRTPDSSFNDIFPFDIQNIIPASDRSPAHSRKRPVSGTFPQATGPRHIPTSDRSPAHSRKRPVILAPDRHFIRPAAVGVRGYQVPGCPAHP